MTDLTTDPTPAEPTPAEDTAPVTTATTAGIEDIDLGSPVAADPVDSTDTAVPTVDNDVQSTFEWPAPVANNNATIDTNYSTPVLEWDDLATTLSLPPDTQARTLNYGAMNPHTADQANTEAGEVWAEAVMEGLGNGSYHDNLMAAAKREGADYRQRIQAADRTLSIAAPRFGDDEGPLLVGERAMLRVNALMGRGSIMQIPLWHSGFWITLKNPGEVELLDALQRISDNKIAFGRSTNGLSFANHIVVSNDAVISLAMRNLFECSVAGFTTGAQVRPHISALDIPIIAWGLACVVYPKGFQFERALLDDKGIALKVVKEFLNVGACLFTDRNSLNDWQIAHMAKRATGSMKLTDLDIYASHFTRGQSKLVMLTDKVGITLKVPKVDDYLNAGQRWIDELVAAVSAVFTQDVSDQARNEMIYERAKATSMRQYVHWIESIDVPEIGKGIKDPETLEMTIANMSADDTTRDKYYQVVQSFINDSIVAMVGVPQVHPEEASQTVPRFENIIPLDPIAVFFNLLYQKIQQIRQRP